MTELLRTMKIRPSRSPFGASLFLVKKKGNQRAVVHYRVLNRIAKRNNSPIPRAGERFDHLGESKFFSKLDLKTGFHQIHGSRGH